MKKWMFLTAVSFLTLTLSSCSTESAEGTLESTVPLRAEGTLEQETLVEEEILRNFPVEEVDFSLMLTETGQYTGFLQVTWDFQEKDLAAEDMKAVVCGIIPDINGEDIMVLHSTVAALKSS